MEVTKQDAAIMYARACRAWYGRRAPKIVRAKVQELQRKGDRDGVEAWSEVARQLSRMPNLDADHLASTTPRAASEARP